MPVMPLNPDSKTWLISILHKVNGEDKLFKEEFVGTIKEAMFREMQLRGLAKDGIQF